MGDLEQARDHARAMAAWAGDPRDRSVWRNGWCVDFPDFPTRNPHSRCDGIGSRLNGAPCCCDCHPRDPGPTDTERALWTQLADEIDAHLAAATSGDDQPMIGDDQ